jgi:predicted restriction endonuclease
MPKQDVDVIVAMEQLGGYATLYELYFLTDYSNWKTKTPEASIRRIVQNSDAFFKIKPGLWALTNKKDFVMDKLGETENEDIINENLAIFDIPEGKETQAIVNRRINQIYFRRKILSSYQNKWCVTGLSLPPFLEASHIVPWSVDKTNRLNPTNGLCLNSIHHKAFDCGYLTITLDYKVKLSKHIEGFSGDKAVEDLFLEFNEKSIILPSKYKPAKEFLEYHNREVFKND